MAAEREKGVVIGMKKEKIAGIALAAVNIVLIVVGIVLYLGADRKEPSFEFQAMDIIYEEGMETSRLLEGISAYDNEDGEITDKIVIEKLIENRELNSVVVIYGVSDKAGNVAKCSREFAAIFREAQEGKNPEEETEVQDGWLMQSGFWTELEGNGNAKDESLEDGLGSGGTEEEGVDGNGAAGDEAAGNGTDASGNREGGNGADAAGNAAGGNGADAAGNREGDNGAAENRAGEAGAEGERAGERTAGNETGEEEDDRNRTQDNGEQAAGEDAAGGTGEENARETAEENTEKQQERSAGNRNAPDPEAPVLALKVAEVKTSVGAGPAWVEIIGTLSDDKDGYETLFHNLEISKYDKNQPGTYEVTVSTKDSDGNRSQTVPLTIIVK